MRILVTGAQGFVGKNLVASLKTLKTHEVFEVDANTSSEELELYTRNCEFIYHLAGVNRPNTLDEFATGNVGFTLELLNLIKKIGVKVPILLSSSVQASLDNPYGKSKKEAEELIFAYGKENQLPVYVYRLHNLFGKWARPNYNSVVATFCYNIAHDLPITITNPETMIELCHIDDVINEFMKALDRDVVKIGQYCDVPSRTAISLKELSDKIYEFRKTRDNLHLPNLTTRFDHQLYGTYLSYLANDDFGYLLKKNTDQRGWLSEFIKAPGFGQVFISKTHPGITRGNHWHHTKAEKFLVISGKGVIRFRQIFETEVIEYPVDGDSPQVIDIPTGYTHSITNTGDVELITLFWSTEIFNASHPDTNPLEV